MPRHHAEPALRLDRADAVPLTVQLAAALRAAMSDGSLVPGERLPSSRTLAAQLAVSRTVVTDAYQQLYAEGWLEGRHGSGTFVAPGAAPAPVERGPIEPAWRTAAARGGGTARHEHRPSRTELRERGLIDLRPGAPWVHAVDRAAWRRAWRHAADLPHDDDPDPRGLPRLRGLLADHLRRARGIAVGPENILVTRGTGNGLDLTGAALIAPGDRAGVEEPGYGKARTVLAARGARIVPCPVDGDGLVTDGLPRDLGLVYTTPAHQYPLGGRLPVPRRERLIAWARETGAVVVEDDYDAEFRYDVAPLPALYGMDPGRVVLLGTLSKTLTPDLGIGWIVAEPDLVEHLARVRHGLTDRTPGAVQAATALLLERGDLDRHLRRMRLEYARRRALVIEHLGPRLTGDTAGLHAMLPLPAEAVAPVVAEAAAHGVIVDDTGRTSHAEPTVHGLVLGYGSAHPADLRRGCASLAAILDRRLGPA
ncbi:MocR-like pyridoxine biosynthesis transcription factor PdxR [Nocardiopsis lambiniae]|uniref:PLP-dependent aminotransferase family protein n=1 Tax=Nocardiopsis lambiniae TaxID=3075539 RepID=A0ABU2M7G6_9ACTN|nr:PLP-dependent aminotransferase family protein [Nocardiopsis sp. DSM 44743]MDT0328467.1 PLP-dependent aminotransferase family protein [Nocardiopsis sp. DSM 44743]